MNNVVYRYAHKWTNEKVPIVFYTIPMIHIGDKSFYERVNKIIDEFNHVLLEGISLGPKYKEIGKYNLLSHKVGLSTQWEELKIPDDIRVINIDIAKGEMNARLKKLNRKEKLLLRTFEKAVKKLKVEDNIKGEIITGLKYPESMKIELIDPGNHYYFQHRKKEKLKLLIENDRDQIFQTEIDKYIKENKSREFRIDTGIVVGDNHMPAIYRELEAHKYKWELLEKLIVIK